MRTPTACYNGTIVYTISVDSYTTLPTFISSSGYIATDSKYYIDIYTSSVSFKNSYTLTVKAYLSNYELTSYLLVPLKIAKQN